MNNLTWDNVVNTHSANIDLRSGRATVQRPEQQRKRTLEEATEPEPVKKQITKTLSDDPILMLDDISIGYTPGNCHIIRLTKQFRENVSSQPENLQLAIQSILDTLLKKSFPDICSKQVFSRNDIRSKLRRLKQDQSLKDKLFTELNSIEVERNDFILPSVLYSFVKTRSPDVITTWLTKYIQNKNNFYTLPMISDEYFKEIITNSEILYVAYEFVNKKISRTGKITYEYKICSFVGLEEKIPSLYQKSLTTPVNESQLIHLALICAVSDPPKSGRIMTIIENDLFHQGIRKIILEAANKNAYDIYKYFNYIHLQDATSSDYLYVKDGDDNMALMEKSI